jgi:dihydrofolate reductase
VAEVVLYIAHSIDGYIADGTGGLSWLKPYDAYDFGYEGFYRGIDALVMGRKTYQDCRTFPEWPYRGKPVVVMTKGRPVDGDGLAVFDDRTPAEIMVDLVQAGRRRIWVVGGGGIVRAFLDARLLDRLVLFQIPEILGHGTPLWPPAKRRVTPRFNRAIIHGNGVVETQYDIGRLDP